MSEKRLQNITEELTYVDEKYWYKDDFRGSLMLPLLTGGGNHKKGMVASYKQPMIWTEPSQILPSLRDFIEDSLKSWLQPMGRVFLLKTPARSKIMTHIDCSKKETLLPQYKFRYVLQGEVSSLYFVDEEKIARAIPHEFPCYLIDGGHPHFVDNLSTMDKITLCIGSPWQADEMPESLLSMDQKLKLTKPEIQWEWCDQVRLEGM